MVDCQPVSLAAHRRRCVDVNHISIYEINGEIYCVIYQTFVSISPPDQWPLSTHTDPFCGCQVIVTRLNLYRFHFRCWETRMQFTNGPRSPQPFFHPIECEQWKWFRKIVTKTKRSRKSCCGQWSTISQPPQFSELYDRTSTAPWMGNSCAGIPYICEP